MKAIKTKFLKSILAVASVSILFVAIGCDVSKLQDAADDFGVVIGLDDIETVPTVIVTDAKTGELVSSDITVYYRGPNGGDVIDIYSDPIVSQTISGGAFNFGITNDLKPSENSPVRIQLNLTADGYVSRSTTIDVTKEGSSEYLVSMVRVGDPPASVSTTVNETGEADGTGMVKSEIKIESKNNQNQDSAGVEVTIPQGVVLTDASGQPLTGRLRTELTNYDPTDLEAMQSFPYQADDDAVDGKIVTGMSTFQVTDENGRVATGVQTNTQNKQLASSHEFQFTFRMHPHYQVQEGDLVSFYAYRIVSWQPFAYSWKRYDDIEVKDLGNGSLGIQFSVTDYPTGLSVFRIVRKGEMQPATINVDRNGHTGYIYGVVYAPGSYFWYRIPSDESSYTIPEVPGINYRVYVYSPDFAYQRNWIFHTQGDANLTLPAPPPMVDATVNVQLVCQDASEEIRLTNIPAASVIYITRYSRYWKLARDLKWNYDEDEQVLTSGSFNVEGVPLNESTYFLVLYDGKYYGRNVRINGQNVNYNETIKDDICS